MQRVSEGSSGGGLIISSSDEPNQLVDNFFRLEAGKMVSTLTRIFGLDNIDLAEDAVQDAMLKALQQWSYGRVPSKLCGRLTQVPQIRELDRLRRRAPSHTQEPARTEAL